MARKLVWYGRMEFGEFKKGADLFPCALIHEVLKRVMLEEEDIEVYLDTYGYDSYLVPSEFKGEIYYTELSK